MKPYRIAFILLFLLSQLASGCVPQAPASQSTEQEVSSLQSQLQAVQDELASYKLIEQNWQYWEQIKALLKHTLAGVAVTRQLPAPDKADIRVVTADWAQSRWGQDYVKGNAKKIEVDERIFKGLFVLPENVSLSQLYSEWPRAYLLATLADTVYFVQENAASLTGESIRKTLAHEVTHMLQGKSFQNPQPATYDEEKAWAALTEGDADFTSARYLGEIGQKEPAPQLPKLSAGTQTTAPDLPRPQSLTKLLYFPYDYGQSFVSRLYQKGGWQAVNEAYSQRPVSTSQIIHPERYLGGNAPKEIERLPIDIAGWTQGKTDRLGEHFIRVMLQNHLPESEAADASRGWAGDRLVYYEKEQSYLFTWQIAWDSGQNAALFNESFVKMLQNLGATKSEDLWRGGNEYLWVKQTDNQNVLLVVSKDRSMLDAALDALRIERVRTP